MLLVLTNEQQLLLHQRDDKPEILHPGCWAGFGGAVEPGESLDEALRREMLEETGIHISTPVYLGEEIDVEGAGDIVSMYYVSGGIDLADITLTEGAGVAIFDVADALDLTLSPFVRRALVRSLLPRLGRH